MKRRVLVLTTCAILACFSLTFAHDNITKKSEVELDDLATWNQSVFPGSEREIIPTGDDTIGESGCGYFALTALLRKMSLVGKEFTPITLIDEYVRPNRMTNTDWGHFDFYRLKELPFSLSIPYIFRDDITFKSGYASEFSGTQEEQLEVVKELMNKGYYILLCMENGYDGYHYVALDYVDKQTGNIRIFDSGYDGTWLHEKYIKEDLEISYAIIIEGDIPSTETKSFYTDTNAIIHNIRLEKAQALMRTAPLRTGVAGQIPAFRKSRTNLESPHFGQVIGDGTLIFGCLNIGGVNGSHGLY